MKRASFVVLAWLLSACAVAGAAGCGGPDKPTQAPTTDPSLDTPSGGGGGGGGAGAGGGGASDKGGADSQDFATGVNQIKAADWAGAKASFTSAVGKSPKHAEAHHYLGVALDQLGDKASAEKEYAQALALKPDLVEAAENLTAVYVEEQKFDDAVATAKKGLAKDPKNASIQLNLGVALAGKGDQEGAKKAFEDAIKAAPNEVRFYLAYAQQLYAWKKNDEAIAKLKDAQRVAGDDAAMVGSIAFAFKEARAVPECIAGFDKAISVKDNADFRTNRGLCKLAAKDRAGALADFQAAVKQSNDYAPAHYWLATELHQDGKFKEAQAEYEAYLKVAPNGAYAKPASAKLDLAKQKKPPQPKK